jgi:regulator of sigma E protease
VNLTIAILGLAVLILLHEAGHFYVARAVGMSPRRFYLGFPPALVRVRRKGIEYGIGAIPLGGYVKIPGMHRPAPSDLDVQFGPLLREQPRLVGPVARVKHGLEVGDLEAARAALPELEAATEEVHLSASARRLATRALTELRDGLAADAYWRQRTWKRITVIFAGPGMNLLIAVLLPMIAFLIGAPGKTNRIVKKVDADHPAARMGLKPGDEIIGVDGVRTPDYTSLSRRIRGSGGRPIVVTVVRDGMPRTLGPARPVKENGRYILGFEPGWQTTQLGLGAALRKSVGDNWRAAKATVTFLPRLFTRSGRENVSGPVGITDVSRQAIGLNFALFLQILGLISLSLAILNLLPLLPLDGGHILFSLIEGLRGRAVGREVYERVSALGIALFMILMFIGLSNDLSRIGAG